jgi:hypothetical protein
MKTTNLFKPLSTALINHSVFLLFLLSTISTFAQTPANFTGKWQYEKAKSTPDKFERDYDGTVILEITQDPATLTLGEIYLHPERPEWKTSTVNYTLDGKEKVITRSNGTSTTSAKWSQDGKILTITSSDIQNSKEYLMISSYSLSDDGKILTVDKFRKSEPTGEAKGRKIYSKM